MREKTETMARYDGMRLPKSRGRKWEILIEEDRERVAVTRTAAEVKREHRLLRNLPDLQLRAVPLVPDGAELERGERYLDLHDPARGEFSGDGHAHLRPGQRVIARRDTPSAVWRELLDAADTLVGRRSSERR